MKSYNAEIATKENVEFILFSQDRTSRDALAWAKKENFPWAHILPRKHRASGLKKYAKSYVPHFVLIDKEGKILAEGKQAVFAKVKTL